MKMGLNVIELINSLVKAMVNNNSNLGNISIIFNFLIILYSSSNFIVYIMYDERWLLISNPNIL